MPYSDKTKQLEYFRKYNSEKRLKYSEITEEAREKIRVTRRIFAKNNREKIRLKWIEYRKKNRDKLRSYEKSRWPKKKFVRYAWSKKNAIILKEKNRAYCKANRAQERERCRRRIALKKNASINLIGIRKFMKLILSKKSVTCYYCSEDFPPKKIHFDHIVPISRGGAHSVENLCAACQPCNNRKHSKLISEWITLGQQMFSI